MEAEVAINRFRTGHDKCGSSMARDGDLQVAVSAESINSFKRIVVKFLKYSMNSLKVKDVYNPNDVVKNWLTFLEQ